MKTFTFGSGRAPRTSGTRTKSKVPWKHDEAEITELQFRWSWKDPKHRKLLLATLFTLMLIDTDSKE
jgi:hypothetical protein